MKVLKGLATAALVGLMAFVTPSPAMAATAGGTVVMGTAGAALPGGLRVTVLENDDEGVPQGQPSFSPVAADGTFSFEADPAKSHLVGLFYKDVAYSRSLKPGETSGIELKIFETTTDPGVVKVASDSMTVLQSTVEGQGNVMEVLQLLRFRNDSDRTFVGSDSEQAPDPQASLPAQPPARQILKLPIPESAYDLAPADAANGAGLATSGEGRLVTTSPLTPGETSVAYLFKVKVPRTGWQLRRETYNPTDHADLLVGKSLTLTAAPGFELAESKTLGGESYNRYRSGALNPGSVIQADIGFPANGSIDGVWIGFGAATAVLAGLLVAASIRIRRRRAAGGQPKEPAEEQSASPTRQELIDQVAELDEQFDAGKLDQDAYDARRSHLLARLSSPTD